MLILVYDTMWGHPIPLGSPMEGVVFSTDRALYSQADAVVFHIPAWTPDRVVQTAPWRWDLMPAKRPGQIWVAWSMECEEHYPVLRETRFMRHFDLTMTYHLNSDIPVTYAALPGMSKAFREPPKPKTEQSLLAAFISSGFDRSGRQSLLHQLSEMVAVDSYGKFLQNRTLNPDIGWQSKLDTIAGYKFTIAFENACSKDYVTEKFFDPLWAGSVPVYLGAPNVEAFAPGDHCFINAADFQDPQALASYLVALAADDNAYNAYFAWKKKPFRESFTRLQAPDVPSLSERLYRLLLTKLPAAAQASEKAP